MNIETKELTDSLLKMLQERGITIDDIAEISIRGVLNESFRNGYSECLKDVREGLIK